MTGSDNWHRRFGRMWFAILAMFIFISLEGSSRTSMQDKMQKEIDELKQKKPEVVQDYIKRTEIMPACFKGKTANKNYSK